MVACGSSPVTGTGTRSPEAMSGTLTVFAAASLTEAFTDDKAKLSRTDPGLALEFSFAGSQQLVAQLQSGAPADVVATADEPSMQKLVAAGLVEPPRDFAANVLEVVVAPGNPKQIRSLADLARTDLKVVLADPSVPAGRYGRQVLDRQGIKVNPVSLELDVKSALAKVELGEADAAIVYATDVRSAGARATGVQIPPAENIVARYPVAVVRTSSHPELARAFVDQLVSGAGQSALRARGFLGP